MSEQNPKRPTSRWINAGLVVFFTLVATQLVLSIIEQIKGLS